MMKPADIRDNDTTEGFEYREGNIDNPNPANMAGIAGNTRKTLCFSLLSGLLQCGKMLPLSYMKGGLVIDGLQYKLRENGQYVTSRQSVSFHPSGSNVYTPVCGTRVMRIVLSDSAGAWVDPESIKLQYDVVNKESDAAKRLRPLTPWGFFKKCVLLVADLS